MGIFWELVTGTTTVPQGLGLGAYINIILNVEVRSKSSNKKNTTSTFVVGRVIDELTAL
jgi:hypothetical protein